MKKIIKANKKNYYHVLYCDSICGFIQKTFDNITAAKLYIRRETKGFKPYNSNDTDNGNNHFWFEITKNTNVVDAIFTSRTYYK